MTTPPQHRILFVLRHPLYLRLYESSLEQLAAHGHAVEVLFTHGEEDMSNVPETLQRLPQISWTWAPRTAYIWRTLGDVSRGILDYWRYLEPEYADADRLRARARRKLAPGVAQAAAMPYFTGSTPRRERVSRRLRQLEAVLPPSRTATRAVQRSRPDLLLISPLVDLSYEQVDYVKAARAAGVPSALCVASWDNLTNKGLIHEHPDAVIVWNDAQRQEAVRLHGIQPDRVAVTGAAVYDVWFSTKASLDRDAFLSGLGLDPAQRTITYVGSSGFIARTERQFLAEWMAHVRSAANPMVAKANIVVRPHPQNAAQLGALELPPGVVVWPRKGAVPITDTSREDYFHTLFHSDAVVGINTSAFIEAGIMGRRVLAVTTPQTAPTQTGTLHFHHLVRFGLLETSSTFTGHVRDLGEALAQPTARAQEREAFLRDFIRPGGLLEPATDLFVSAVEALLGMPVERAGASGPAWVRPVLFPAAVAFEGARRARRRKRQDA